MEKQHSSGFKFDFTGGRLCLDFANTVSHRFDPQQRNEHLASYADLLAFAQQARSISPNQAGKLASHAQRSGSEAGKIFREAISLREALYHVFSAAALGKTPPASDLLRIGNSAVQALQHRRLARANGSYRWEWQWNEDTSLQGVLWPIAQSAAELLTSDELGTVRLCEAADCEWLFLDRSRNRSRRWCDMTTCGNRQKARRHYQRLHE